MPGKAGEKLSVGKQFSRGLSCEWGTNCPFALEHLIRDVWIVNCFERQSYCLPLEQSADLLNVQYDNVFLGAKGKLACIPVSKITSVLSLGLLSCYAKLLWVPEGWAPPHHPSQDLGSKPEMTHKRYSHCLLCCE